MHKSLLSLALITGFFLPLEATHAQDANQVTATCKDGTAFTGTKRSGACRGHGGVQSWGTATESSGAVSPAIAPAANSASAKTAAGALNTGTVTVTCKDGTAFTGTKRSGACRDHGGVQSWGTAEAATVPTNAPAQLATPAPHEKPARCSRPRRQRPGLG
ncbi:MAG: DUF3761 domain-containing protein [Acetobacteraceae bacterium]|nr:DUF3761 domain-containing protein [Acetobacteraceae bacterium]